MYDPKAMGVRALPSGGFLVHVREYMPWAACDWPGHISVRHYVPEVEILEGEIGTVEDIRLTVFPVNGDGSELTHNFSANERCLLRGLGYETLSRKEWNATHNVSKEK